MCGTPVYARVKFSQKGGSKSNESCPISIFKSPSISDTRRDASEHRSHAAAGKSYKAVHSTGCQSLFPRSSRYDIARLYIALRRMPITRRTRTVTWKFPTYRSNIVGSASRAQFAFLVLHASILVARFRLSTFRRDIPAGFDRHALGSICRMRCLRHAEEPCAEEYMLVSSWDTKSPRRV